MSPADEDSVCRGWIKGKEVIEPGQGKAVEGFDERRVTSAGGGDNVCPAVAVDVGGRHPHTAGEDRAVGQEAGRFRAGDIAGRYLNAPSERGAVGIEVVQKRSAGATEDLDLRPAAVAGGGDDVGFAVAVDVPGRHEHAPRESGIVSQEIAHGAGELQARL